MYQPKLPWQIEALEDLKNTTLSRSEIAKKYRRDVTTIRKLITDSGVTRPVGTTKSTLKSLDQVEPISPHHRWLGAKISVSPNLVAIRDQLGVSYITFSRMQLGQYDFTLSDLHKLAPMLRMSFADMMQPPSKIKGGPS